MQYRILDSISGVQAASCMHCNLHYLPLALLRSILRSGLNTEHFWHDCTTNEYSLIKALLLPHDVSARLLGNVLGHRAQRA